MKNKNLQIISEELKSINYDSYLCATFSLREDFEKIASISLLQSELMKISDLTQEDMIGMIRLAWWQENLEEVFTKNKVAKHHLLESISSFKDEVNFPLLDHSFPSFEKDFAEEKKFQNKEELEEYIFRTHGTFIAIILKILGHENERLTQNLAIISFYFDLLKKIQFEDEKISRFFYPDFFEELNIDMNIWQKSAKKDNHEENLVLVVKHIVQTIESAAKNIKIDLKNSKNRRISNLLLRKELILIFLKDLRKNNFDIFSTNLSSRKSGIKLRFLGRVLRNSLF